MDVMTFLDTLDNSRNLCFNWVKSSFNTASTSRKSVTIFDAAVDLRSALRDIDRSLASDC